MGYDQHIWELSMGHDSLLSHPTPLLFTFHFVHFGEIIIRGWQIQGVPNVRYGSPELILVAKIINQNHILSCPSFVGVKKDKTFWVYSMMDVLMSNLQPYKNYYLSLVFIRKISRTDNLIWKRQLPGLEKKTFTIFRKVEGVLLRKPLVLVPVPPHQHHHRNRGAARFFYPLLQCDDELIWLSRGCLHQLCRCLNLSNLTNAIMLTCNYFCLTQQTRFRAWLNLSW